jgi:Fe-S-cluster containining protein
VSEVSDFLENGKWKCTSCGACCSFIKPLADSGGLPKTWVRVDGSCKYLFDKKCAIYKTRPNICRIGKTLKPKHTDHEIAAMCKVMKDHQESLGA